MSLTPKTIQIFLPGGDPRGIRIAEITTHIVQVIEVPRSLLKTFLTMPESDHVALYFLFGAAEDGTEAKVYIGQTGDLRKRLRSHNKHQSFWQRALVMISHTNSMTNTHSLFLEWNCLQAANKAGRYNVKNGNGGSKPHTPAPLEADCRAIFETGRVLLATLGYPIFDAVHTPVSSSEAEEILYCKASGVDGRGLYTSEGFVVLKGSIGRRANTSATIGTSKERMRDKLVESGVCRAEGETVVFEKDHLFGSPSTAAMALTGRTTHGWSQWKNKDGVTLGELQREQSDEKP